jgi:hypothetical protein
MRAVLLVAEMSVGQGGGRPPTFRKIGSLLEIFGFVGILKTIEYTEFLKKLLEREAIHINLIIFRLFSSYMLAVLICSLGQPRSILIFSGSIFENR